MPSLQEQFAAAAKMDDPTAVRYDLACGQRKQPGYKGIDISPDCGADVVCDLEKHPWPIESNSADFVYSSHFIEHVKDFVGFMEDVYRILKPQGTAFFQAPYYSSIRAWQDPTHVREISENCFLYYDMTWMKANKLTHYNIKADFEFQFAFVFNERFANKPDMDREFARLHYINAVDDIAVLAKKRG